jgi:bifunctional DNase/RNase
MPVEMKLSRIIISDINDHQVIYLKEVGGERTFPIVIGIAEASSIDRRVKNYKTSRPLTHDLICLVVETLGAELDSVLISDVEGPTFYARLRMRKDGEIVEVDARPSDAIAVAVSCDPPLSIYVEEKVLESAIAEA